LLAKKPEELADWYNNVLEMQRAATQKNQEVNEILRKIEEEKIRSSTELQKLQEENELLFEELNRLKQIIPERQQSQIPDFTTMTTEEINRVLYDELRKTRESLEALHKKYEEEIKEVKETLTAKERADGYYKFLEKEIYPLFPDYIPREEINDKINSWFTQKDPTGKIVPVNPDTVRQAAKEIKESYDNMVKTALEEVMKKKDELNKQSQGIGSGGSGAGIMPPNKSVIDLPEEEQVEILKKYWHQLKE